MCMYARMYAGDPSQGDDLLEGLSGGAPQRLHRHAFAQLLRGGRGLVVHVVGSVHPRDHLQREHVCIRPDVVVVVTGKGGAPGY